AELGLRAKGRIGRAGVFLDASDAAIGEAVAAAGLDVLQLHGSESPARCAELRARTSLPVWKVLAVAARADLDRARAYAGAADLVLLDAKTPKGSLPGGLGLAFDWALLTGWQAPLPWGLAGGLSPANVADAVRCTGAPLIDASSGLETAPGIKDPALIAAFCAAARSA
ncbi:MAG: phosphoribosylanthranilate isomerase, partial [Novosphingobium sp.]